jgi:N4-gp56 family major capsid protein
MKFRQFVQYKEALGMNKNDTVYFPKISNIDTAGGTLVETDTIPQNQFTMERGTIVITEYGNSIPFSGKLDALAEFDVDNVVTRVLRDDMAKVVDQEVAGYFDRCELKWSSQGTGSYNLETCSDGTATQTCDGDVFADDVYSIIDEMKVNNVAKYDGSNYICIASVAYLSDMKTSTDWLDAAKYGDPERLFAGEVGRFAGCRFIEENNYLSNTQGTTSLGGEAIYFGADAIMEAVAIPEELRAKVPTDYGRSQGIAWYGLFGFAKIWDVATDGQPKIIHHNPSVPA